MLIIPAINIKSGQCVAVSNYQINETKVYSDDIEDVVGRWFDKGIKRLHLIDLDGVIEGKPVNAGVISQLAFRFPNLSMQVSGGIRSLADIEMYLKAGLDYIVLGTLAVQDPELVIKASQALPAKIIVSIDALNGKVSSDGRTKKTDLDAYSFVSHFDLPSMAGLIFSDTLSTVQGVNIDAVANLADSLSVPVMAMGGIEDMDDIRALFAESHKGIFGAISAEALRNGSLDFLEAQAYCDEFEE